MLDSLAAGHRVLNEGMGYSSLQAGNCRAADLGVEYGEAVRAKRPPRNSLVNQTIFPQRLCAMYRRDPDSRDRIVPGESLFPSL
jgi:hypothetical protein